MSFNEETEISSGPASGEMVAEVLSIGTELLLGQITDTNAACISALLPEWGINLYRRTTVGDNLKRIVDVMREAFMHADVVISTGGLGPTMDDLTREAIAELWGLEMVEDPGIIRRLEEFFAGRGYGEMPLSNRKQALKPVGGTLIDNPVGTAPGLFIEHEGKAFAALPGPPFEMKPMLPQLQNLLRAGGFAGRRVILSRVLHTGGIGESALEKLLEDVIKSQTNPTIAPLANPAGVDLRLTAAADTEAAAGALLDAQEAVIRESAGSFIYGRDDQSLENVVEDLLHRRELTLALAESCTGGLVAHLLTNVPGVSTHFKGSMVSYSNEAKIDILGVEPGILDNYGAVSPECARAMADGTRKVLGADIGLSLTGIAGPGGGSESKPVGLVYIGLSTPAGTSVKEGRFRGGREENKMRFARTALNILRLYLADAGLKD